MKTAFLLALLLLVILGTVLVAYLFRPLKNAPDPADFECYQLSEGTFVKFDSLPEPTAIYAMGLTYSAHIRDAALDFDSNALPPVFRKPLETLKFGDSELAYPTRSDIIEAVRPLDPALANYLDMRYPSDLSPLLDYEVELGMVVLEDVSRAEFDGEGYIPKLGFFLANDISSRTIQILGEGTGGQRMVFWGLSKGLPGFLPVSETVWIPNESKAGAIPCVELVTKVNGEVRQSSSTDNMIYDTKQMMRFIFDNYRLGEMHKGDIILTGTPGGVAFHTPRQMMRLSNLLGLTRFQKLKFKLGDADTGYLKPGDEVTVSSQIWGDVTTKVVSR